MIIIMSRTIYKKFTSNLIWSLDCISCATARFTFTLTTVVSRSSLVMVTVAFSVESTLTVLDGSLSLSSADAGREREGEGGREGSDHQHCGQVLSLFGQPKN